MGNEGLELWLRDPEISLSIAFKSGSCECYLLQFKCENTVTIIKIPGTTGARPISSLNCLSYFYVFFGCMS